MSREHRPNAYSSSSSASRQPQQISVAPPHTRTTHTTTTHTHTPNNQSKKGFIINTAPRIHRTMSTRSTTPLHDHSTLPPRTLTLRTGENCAGNTSLRSSATRCIAPSGGCRLGTKREAGRKRRQKHEAGRKRRQQQGGTMYTVMLRSADGRTCGGKINSVLAARDRGEM